VTKFLIDDHVIALAKTVVEMFRLPSHQQPEAFEVICDACRAAFISYEQKAGLIRRTMRPGKN
jgi:hypothetical protein